MTTMPEMPEVAHLDERINSVDLSALGADELDTWFTYPGIALGDLVMINWRGCTADGRVNDIFTQIELLELDASNRYRMVIANSRMQDLRGGTVFYSFQPLDSNGQQKGDESRRRFFYVERPAEGMWTLPTAHLQDAHDLVINVETLKPEGVLLATAPYVAMAVGDKVFLTWEPYFDEFMPGMPVELRHDVVADDLGQPLSWHLEIGDVFNYMFGFAFLRYRIEYANGGASQSPDQRFEIVLPSPGDPPAQPLLAAPSIPGHVGDTLNPDDDAYREGVWLEAAAYPELRVGDSLVLYVEGPQVKLRSLRADVTSLDSERLAFFLDREWLQSEANRGKQITFSYEFSRQGVQKRSQVLSVVLQRPLYLPLPQIKDVTQDEGDLQHQGKVHPRNLVSGAEVRIPADAELGEGELPAPQISMHWEGHGSTGWVVIPQPVSGDRRLFKVPRSAIAANLGRRLNVYYTVTRSGQIPQKSQVFELRVEDYDQGSYPHIQVAGVENQQVSLRKVPSTGALCTLGAWAFMAEGQFVGIEAAGVPKRRRTGNYTLRPRMTEVSEDEYYDGKILAYLPKSYLQGLQLHTKFRLSVAASFDDGETWRDFSSVDIELIP